MIDPLLSADMKEDNLPLYVFIIHFPHLFNEREIEEPVYRFHVYMYRITFFNLITKKRQIYLNNTAFDSINEVKDEIERLKKQQQHYVYIHYPVTRSDFRYEKIK